MRLFLLFRRARLEQTLEHPLQGGRVEIAGDAATNHHRNLAGFFGDDDGHRIDQFGQTDGRPMPGAEGFADIGVLAEGEKTAGPRQATLLNDQGAIMDRRVWEERWR